jgi:uncharacterized LabA/DUF88 family protein
MTEPTASSQKTRVRVFIDYWNFQLSLNSKEARRRGISDYRFRVDWRGVGSLLATKACEAAAISDHAFEGVIIYASYNPNTDDGKKFNNWATTWLNRQPGVQVECRPRSPKRPPKCPSCYREIEYCPLPGCGQKIVATVEKGVDTLIATDMIRLAWENAYDLAVLATSDADLVPAVEFLNLKARRVIQAGFPPLGTELATACWASFDAFKLREQLERT